MNVCVCVSVRVRVSVGRSRAAGCMQPWLLLFVFRDGKPGRILFGVLVVDVSIEYIYSALIGIYPPCTHRTGIK